jgi:hypothetical protein
MNPGITKSTATVGIKYGTIAQVHIKPLKVLISAKHKSKFMAKRRNSFQTDSLFG